MDSSKTRPNHAVEPPRETAAEQRVAAIVASQSYRPADRDLDFLASDSLRGLRLAMDYEKAESLLEAHRIAHAIVVFGSANLREPAIAARQLGEAQAAALASPGDRQIAQALQRAKRLMQKSAYYDLAREFGRLVSSSQCGPSGDRVVIMTGGGPGIMEAANRGASDVGAHSVGLNITLSREQAPNPYVSPELCFSFRYFAMRKLHFLRRARALVAFPGGYGTLDELFEMLTLIQTGKQRALPVVLVGRTFWEQAVNIDFLVAEGMITQHDRELYCFAESAAEAWQIICDWHAQAGTEGFPGTVDRG